MIDTWDIRFLEHARLVASWSKDPSTRVGAVIADCNHRVVSVGYNGFPRKVPDELDKLKDREVKLKMTIHAELNAILFSHRSLEGTTLYVTRHPCAGCAALVVQVGISRVVSISDPEFESRWKRDVEFAEWIMGHGGVEHVTVEPWLLSSV